MAEREHCWYDESWLLATMPILTTEITYVWLND